MENTDDEDVKLSVIEPAPLPTPVAVGAEGGSDEEGDHESPSAPDVPDSSAGSE